MIFNSSKRIGFTAFAITFGMLATPALAAHYCDSRGNCARVHSCAMKGDSACASDSDGKTSCYSGGSCFSLNESDLPNGSVMMEGAARQELLKEGIPSGKVDKIDSKRVIEKSSPSIAPVSKPAGKVLQK